MNKLVSLLARSGLLAPGLDHRLLRAAMVVIFVWFGYDKWFDVEIRDLVPLIENGPLLSWMLPTLGISGTSVLLGTAEWTFALLLFLGFWDSRLGLLGAIGSCVTFVGTLTVFPFAPGASHPEAGGFPAMTIVSAFLLKDLVLLAVSVYLVRHEVQLLNDAAGPG